MCKNQNLCINNNWLQMKMSDGEVIKRTWLPGDLWAGCGKSGMPCLYSSLECAFSSPFPQPEPFQGCSLDRERVVGTIWTVCGAEPCYGCWQTQDSDGWVWSCTHCTAFGDKPPQLSPVAWQDWCLVIAVAASFLFPHPLRSGTVFRFHLGNAWVCEPMLLLLLQLLLSRFSRVRLCDPSVRLVYAAHQAPPSLAFSRQEHWSVNRWCPNNDSQITCKILRNKIKKKRNRDYLSKTV